MTTPDPISAAIEKHMAANVAFDGYVRAHENIAEDDPTYAGLSQALDEAGTDIANIRPSTMAGNFALLDYVDEYSRGVIKGMERKTDAGIFPDWMTDTDVLFGYNRPAEGSFEFWPLRNVRTALASMVLV